MTHPSTARALLASTLALLAACSRSTTLVLEDAATGGDASTLVDGGSTVVPDAARGEPDAFVPEDGGPSPGGCFDDTVSIWTSSAGPGSRAHPTVLAMAAYEHGWLVFVSGLHDDDQLVLLDRAGAVRSTTVVDGLYGQSARAVVLGDSLYFASGNRVSRLDLDEGGIARTWTYDFVGGLAPSAEVTVALERLADGSGLRAVSLHRDPLTSRVYLRLSEIRPDTSPTSGTGLTIRSSEIVGLPEITLEGSRFTLEDDHLHIVSLGLTGRVVDAQLGLGTLGESTIASRIHADSAWDAPPELVLGLTRGGERALTVRLDATSVRVGLLEALPPRTPETLVLGDGLELGHGLLGTAFLDDPRALVVASDHALGLYDHEGGSLVSIPLAAELYRPIQVASRDGEVAAAFALLDGEDRTIAVRCAALP